MTKTKKSTTTTPKSKTKASAKTVSESKDSGTRPTAEDSTTSAFHPSYHASSLQDWHEWLETNHNVEPYRIWLIIYHKSCDIPSVYVDDAIDEAICYGWIDSAIRKRDHQSYYQYLSKRNPKSNWSRVNKDKVQRLLECGRMQPSGQAMIDIAKQTGTWTALDNVEDLVLPTELQQLFAKHPKAKTNFDAFPRSVKRGILEWIYTAKQDATKMKRIQETVRHAEMNERANYPKKQQQQKQKVTKTTTATKQSKKKKA